MSSKRVLPEPIRGGEIQVPGDKSISQRIAMLAALAQGTSEIHGYLRGEDAVSTLQALCALGASARFDQDVLFITGTGGPFHNPAGVLDMGNSGTGTRLLAGLISGQPLTATLVGDASLSRRPMGRIKTPLEQMGARVELTGEKGTLPMTVHGATLHGIRYVMPMASAQVKSAVLLAGLFAQGPTSVIEPAATRDHTEKLLESFGVPVEVSGAEICLKGFGPAGPGLSAIRFQVPGDFSSAAFWIAAAAARPGAVLTVRQVGLNPRRTALLDVLRRMGARIETSVCNEVGDPSGTVTVHGACLRGTEIGGDEIPGLIDELPVLAAISTLAEGETIVRDAGELRVKESDRIAVMVSHLQSFGADAQERPDGLVIRGPTRLKPPPCPLVSHGDHRITMSMAILATFADEPVQLADVECVETSYPGFWSDLAALGGRVESV